MEVERGLISHHVLDEVEKVVFVSRKVVSLLRPLTVLHRT